MHRAHGMDAVFLAGETLGLPMHTLSIALHAPSGDAAPLTYDAFLHDIRARILAVPRFRHRPWMVPWGLAQPRWIRDAAFDPSRHVQRATLGRTGETPSLEDLVAALACEPLPRDRPLWQVVFVEGLPGGRTAEILKLHHALADGISTADLLDRVWFADGAPSLESGDRPPTLPSSEQHADLPRWLERLRALPRLVQQTHRGWKARRRTLRSLRLAGLPTSPDSPFDGRVGLRRAFARTELSLSRLRAIKDACGCTLNDALLAVCSGALRRYLLSHGALPPRSLVASVPLSLGDAPYAGVRGNRIASLFADLATNESDPRRRLERIRGSMDHAKHLRATARFDWERWLDSLPPAIVKLGMGTYRRLLRRGWISPPINLVVSNVPGPDRPLTRSGHSVEKMFFIGPLVAWVGLNITAWSYDGTLGLGLLCCPTLIPDLAALEQAFEPALEELEHAVVLPRVPASPTVARSS